MSGGKDSLGLWQLLRELGYEADGLYVGLGIGSYSDRSGDFARAFAKEHDWPLLEIDLQDTYGFDIPGGARAAKRVPCSACGLSKRHVFNDAAISNGYDILATGHNLDDEAAVLLGNVLRWDAGYLGRQQPGAARGARLRAQGETARAAGRARARRVLRAHRHRLHRRGVPDGRGQSSPRLQGHAQPDRGALAGNEGGVPVRLHRARPRPVRRRRGGGARGPSPVLRVRRTHARRGLRVLPPAGPRHQDASRSRSKQRSRRDRKVRGRRSGTPRRQQGAPPPRDARGRRPVPHARRHRCPRRPDRPPRRQDRAHVARRAPRRGAADARRVRARDAARRAGDLPQGHRPDPRARRRLSRRADPRVGRRLRRAHDRAAARHRADRPRHRLRDPRRLRAARRSRTCTASSATTSRSTSRCATSTRASTNAISIGSCSISPSRGAS